MLTGLCSIHMIASWGVCILNAFAWKFSAAAYSQQGDHEKAVSDAKRAIEVDPQYSKGYSRLG